MIDNRWVKRRPGFKITTNTFLDEPAAPYGSRASLVTVQMPKYAATHPDVCRKPSVRSPGIRPYPANDGLPVSTSVGMMAAVATDADRMRRLVAAAKADGFEFGD
ncbi:hypothetical protein [Nonomuraea jiangxiensis]|uniref:hypothetical protein n=1 Tax=Nonomuraea jiangxiensis TaxID=633440 RepID=UPI0011600723|nr:hypothetical protein [Nonomuraea jiangxiensis]